METYERKRHEKSKNDYLKLKAFYPMVLADLQDEIWRPILGYETLYHASNYGRIKSFQHNKVRILSPNITGTYLAVHLTKDGEEKVKYIHRLVAETFIPNTGNKSQVNHIDGNKFNNHVSNLEWVTRKENQRHAVKMNLHKSGEEHVSAKFTNEQVEYVRENPDGLAVKDLAEFFNVDATVISKIQLGKTYKTAGGTIRKSTKKKRSPNVTGDVCKELLRLYVKGSRTAGAAALAKSFGYDATTIWKIVSNKK